MTRLEMLDKVKQIVSGGRDQQYGQPEDNFSTIASFWSVYLGLPIVPEDVAVMMILFKAARVVDSKHTSLDSWVDIAGYAACGAEIESMKD